jgi:hypothetical protein
VGAIRFTLIVFYLVNTVLAAAAETDCDEVDKKVRALIHEVAICNPQPGKYEMYQGKQAKIFQEIENWEDQPFLPS